jgi:two-component system chemotaxis response regulator CheY
MVVEAIQAGARDFIVKPFQPDRVLEAVRKAVG